MALGLNGNLTYGAMGYSNNMPIEYMKQGNYLSP